MGYVHYRNMQILGIDFLIITVDLYPAYVSFNYVFACCVSSNNQSILRRDQSFCINRDGFRYIVGVWGRGSYFPFLQC